MRNFIVLVLIPLLLLGCGLGEANVATPPFTSPSARIGGPTGDTAETQNIVGKSSFAVTWSVPKGAQVRLFVIDFGASSETLINSTTLHADKLTALPSPSKDGELVYRHTVSISGDYPTLAVRVTALMTDGRRIASTVFDSPRI